MDFRTEWWSKALVVIMIVIAAYINPWEFPQDTSIKNILVYVGYILGLPFMSIAIATIPVFIICWVMKIMPDLDYSIWLAFAYMLYLLISFLI